MAELEFSVPYNNDPKTLKEIFKLKKLESNTIREIYLSGPQVYSGSGRITDEINMGQFLNLVNEIHSEGLRVNLVLNSTCEGTEWYSPNVINEKMEYLKRVHKEYGVEAVTIANPLYMQEVRRLLPDIEICASVLCDIDSVQRAVIFKKAGANVMTPDVNINRNLGLLKEIKNATNVELKLMVNEGCLCKCPFRKFHFNYMSHKSKDLGKIEGDAFFANCTRVTREDLTQILKSCWIRPEDVSKYNEITKYFKIVGRARPKSLVVRAIKAYMNENWDGDLLDILCSSLNKFGLQYGANLDNKSLDSENDFFKKITSSDESLKSSYYEELTNKLIKFGVVTREKLEDLGHANLADELKITGKLP